MLLGDFESAWRESDAIRLYDRGNPDCLWNGGSFDQRVIVRCLHGYGDAIQFIRYARRLRHSATRVIVECARLLVSLFKCQTYIDEVISWDDGTSKGYSCWDHQIEVMELPQVFRTTLHTIPAEVPYLRLPDTAAPRSPQPRVGVVWGASDWNPLRSVHFELFKPVLECSQASWFSFQHGGQRSAIAGLSNICDTAPDCPTILDTALLLSKMDLLISVDTMVAHLAGALGIPVWLLLPYDADWRWMLDRSDSPWYPGMRLFRQPAPGDWLTPVTRVIAEFRERFRMKEC